MPQAPAPTSSLVPTPQQIMQAVEHHGHLLAWRADGRQFRIQFLGQLAQLADDQGLIPFSQKELLARLELSRGTLENTLAILVKAGALISRGKGRNAGGYQFLPDWFLVPHTSPSRSSAQPGQPGQPRPKRNTRQNARPGELPPWQVAINDLRTEFQTTLQQLRSDLGLTLPLDAGVSSQQLPARQEPPELPPIPEADLTSLRAELNQGFQSLSSLLERLLLEKPIANPNDALPATPIEAASPLSAANVLVSEASTQQAEHVRSAAPTGHDSSPEIEIEVANPAQVKETIKAPEVEVLTQDLQATTRRPGRPLSSNPNKIEARADTLFKYLLPLAEQFQDLTPLDLDSVIQDLAGQELDWQQDHYTQDDGSSNWNTILKTNLRIFKKRLKLQVASFLASHIDSPIGQLADLWCNAFDTLVRPHTWELNSDYRENATNQALTPTP